MVFLGKDRDPEPWQPERDGAGPELPDRTEPAEDAMLVHGTGQGD
jgi:hypothetical protein